MKKDPQSQEIARMIERQNVITFKRKNQGKGSLKSQKQEDDDVESAKSHPSQQPSFSRHTKKSIPLPELNKQKKRLVLRNILPETRIQANNNFLDKEVRQQDNIMLKNQINSLSNENLKLKTKNMNLEKEIVRLQKIVEEDPQKNKLGSSKDIKVRTTESTSLKIALRNLQKELDDLKKQNSKIKTSIKFTTISELEVERDSIIEQTIRLRQMLEEEHNKLMFLRANQHGISAMEQKLMLLQEKNHYLMKEINDLKHKASKSDEKERVHSRISDNQKNLNKMLFNARRLLKEKERELEYVKNELKKQSNKSESAKVIDTASSGLQNSRIREVKSELDSKVQRPDKLKVMKEKRLMSKSAQKYRGSASQERPGECQNCKKFKDQNIVLTTQLEHLKADLEQAKMNKSPIGQLSKHPISIPSQQQCEKLQRFLIHRFKAHHLTLEQAAYHLINYEGKPEDLQRQIQISELLEIAMAEPFSILSDRSIETFVVYLCYNQFMTTPPTGNKCSITESKKLKRGSIMELFKNLVGDYELQSQSKEEEMFIQIAELVTQYQQHILKALNDKRNTQSTIPEKDFYEFFKQIELEKDYIDFMVSQIILESLDLDHLNIYNLFEIFYMPPQEQLPTQPNQGLNHPQKKKFNIIQSVVKEQDEQYEESKSFMESRQKSLSKHEQGQQQYEQQGLGEAVEHNDKGAPNESYEQHFEEEKMENPTEEQKANEENQKPLEPEHYNIENIEEEYVDDYQN